jgi:cyanophycin synthetase
LVAAAEREPAHVIGDGISSIKDLIEKANADPRRGFGHEKVLTQIEIDDMTESETEKWAELQERIEKAEQMIEWVSSQNYLDRLQGTLGADWIHREKH